MYGRILVPVDGSETSRLGLKEAIELAKSLRARIRVVHIVNKLHSIASVELAADMVQALVDQLRSSGECILHDSVSAARAAGVEVDSRLIEAMGTEAGECIVEEATSWPADLIVCGTHGRRGLRRVLMGSDAEYVLRRSPVPVLMVRAPGVAEQP
ncbi:MAG TPA: universal stress protein [Steroidobacteraceae bacterium]|nr:universal stress protein [Steroidobacteraceae bacterium]